MNRHLKILAAGLIAATSVSGAVAADFGSEGHGNSSTGHSWSLVDKVLRTDPSQPLPTCDNRRVISQIIHRFNNAERKTWKRGFSISQVSHPHSRGDNLRQDAYGEPPLVPIRYCETTAHMTNGKNYSMHYFIEAKMGFVGVSWGTEFCVHGLDPWRVYNGACEIAHPVGAR